MGKNPRVDPVEQLAKYMRIIAWISMCVAGTGFVYLIYSILSGK